MCVGILTPLEYSIFKVAMKFEEEKKEKISSIPKPTKTSVKISLPELGELQDQIHCFLFTTDFALVVWQRVKCISGKRNSISWHCGLSRFPLHWIDKWSSHNVLLKVLFQLLLYYAVIPTGNSPSLVLTIKSSFQLGCCTCYIHLNAALFFQLYFSFLCKNIVGLCNSEAVVYCIASGR